MPFNDNFYAVILSMGDVPPKEYFRTKGFKLDSRFNKNSIWLIDVSRNRQFYR